MVYTHFAGGDWVPTGCYAWKGRGPWMPTIIANELKQRQAGWPPLQGGMFDGNPDKALKAHETVASHTQRLGWA